MNSCYVGRAVEVDSVYSYISSKDKVLQDFFNVKDHPQITYFL